MYILIKALHSQNKCEEAIKCYDEALAINPKFADALNYKGVII
jgi:tetratricopeptide (TPR) repeat protein